MLLRNIITSTFRICFVINVIIFISFFYLYFILLKPLSLEPYELAEKKALIDIARKKYIIHTYGLLLINPYSEYYNNHLKEKYGVTFLGHGCVIAGDATYLLQSYNKTMISFLNTYYSKDIFVEADSLARIHAAKNDSMYFYKLKQ